MKKIVIINQSTGDLTIDVVNAFTQKYDNVVLLAGRVKVTECPLDAKVKVDRIVAYNRSSMIRRMITWLVGTIQVFFKLLLKYRGWKVMYFTNPPMSYWCALALKSKFSVVEYDIYPDALRNIGIKECNPIFYFWNAVNRVVFKKAEKIITLSDGMADTLSKYVDCSKIKVVPNWCTSSKLRPIDKVCNPFVREHHLEDKFVVMYSGNIGYTHNVEILVDVAECLRDDKEVMFCIIGEGMKKTAIMQKVKERGLDDSFLFLTWQSAEMLPYSLSAADLGVVTLNDVTAKLSVPSKTYNLLACGVPLLAIAPQISEMGKLVYMYGNGACFDKSQAKEMAAYICHLKSNPEMLKTLSDNSILASKNFTAKNAEMYVEE